MNFTPIDNKQLIETSSLLKLIANNDINGNPQHLYLHLNNRGRILKVYDVLYEGINSVPAELQMKAIQADSIYISVKEYKRLLKLHEN
tara:strand:+ start:474 stop:737 length:264 start_codon:yes stop_codon:yes gene_type:complete